MAGMRATLFLELGPGTELSGMVKRTVPEAARANVAAPHDLETLGNLLLAQAGQSRPEWDGGCRSPRPFWVQGLHLGRVPAEFRANFATKKAGGATRSSGPSAPTGGAPITPI